MNRQAVLRYARAAWYYLWLAASVFFEQIAKLSTSLALFSARRIKDFQEPAEPPTPVPRQDTQG